MSMIRTNNPMLSEDAFSAKGAFGSLSAGERSNAMTLQGTVNATLILMGLCIAAAVACWTFLQQDRFQGLIFPVTLGGSVAALVLVLVCHFKPAASPYLGWLIAICEGCLAGGASIIWSAYAGRKTGEGVIGQLGTGLVLQASLLTAGIAVSLLIAYKTRLIRATENFKLAVTAATGGILLVSLGSMLLGMFGVRVPYLWENGLVGIGFAGFVVVVAAMNLVLDFDFIEQGAENQLPKHMEWYAGIGLLVTLVWLYISLLRLLAMLANRK
jgi:uncharacterized YccA/Bax inhibitor family protein